MLAESQLGGDTRRSWRFANVSTRTVASHNRTLRQRALAGLAVGLLLSAAALRVIRSVVFGVQVYDAVTLVGTVMMLGVVAACRVSRQWRTTSEQSQDARMAFVTDLQ